jgi:hypothetical protein
MYDIQLATTNEDIASTFAVMREKLPHSWGQMDSADAAASLPVNAASAAVQCTVE